MILAELCELAQRQSLPPIACWECNIGVSIYVDTCGSFTGCVVHKTLAHPELPSRWFPFIEPTVSGKPSVGIHKLEHILGAKFNVTGKAGSRTLVRSDDNGCARKMKTLHYFANWLTNQLPTTTVTGWRDFLISTEGRDRLLNQLVARAEEHNLSPGDYAAVYVQNMPWWQADDVVHLWQNQARNISDVLPSVKGDESKLSGELTAGGVVRTGQCLVCGREKDEDGNNVEVERLLPSFDSLILTKYGPKVAHNKLKFTSFNRAAYASRGQLQSYNAPICIACSDRAAKGWNSLMRSESSRFLLDDQVLGFWGEPRVKPWAKQTAADSDVWRKLLLSPVIGRPTLVAPMGIRVLGLGSHESSAFVTVWLQRDAQVTSDAIVRWGRWQGVIGADQMEFYSLTDLVKALRPRRVYTQVRRTGTKSQELSAHEARLWRDLLYLSLGIGSVPPYVLNRLVERLATELEVSHNPRMTPRLRKREREGIETNANCYPLDRIVLLNICLCSINNLEVINVSDLKPNQQNAFNAGRIFNLICYAQRKAIGDTGKNVLSSNARLAATRPAQVLGELTTRLNEIYLKKLFRDNPATAGYVQREIQSLWTATTLSESQTPEEMGWFWKGFYHRAEKEDKP